MLKHNPFVSCNINNTKEINDIVKASCVKIMPLTRSVQCEWKNKSHPSNQCVWYCECPPPYTLDIDNSGGNNSCSFSDVAECSIILDKNSPPSEFLPDCNTVYTSWDTRIFSQSHPLPLITEHTHPFGLKNPKFQCFLPEASFGLRVLSSPLSVYLSVCLCVYQSLACPHDNSSAVQARITKFENRCKKPWLRCLLFWGVINLELQGQI